MHFRKQKLPAVFFIFLSTSAMLHGESLTLNDWLSDMKEVHPTYRRVVLEQEIAELNRTKSLIEASTEEQQLRGEISYISTLASLDQQLISFYTDVADAAFTVALEKTDLQISALEKKIAGDAFALVREQYQKGLVSAEEVEEKRIGLEEAETNFLQAEEAEEDAKRYFHFTTGQEWRPEVTGLFTLFPWLPDEDQWRDADFSLQKTGFQLILARYYVGHLPANAPSGEKRIREIGLEQAELAAKSARFEADRTFGRTILNLKNELQTAQLLQTREKLEQQQVEAARIQFNQGAVSEQVYDQQQVKYLRTRRNSLDATLEYITTLFGAVVAAGFLPEEILQ